MVNCLHLQSVRPVFDRIQSRVNGDKATVGVNAKHTPATAIFGVTTSGTITVVNDAICYARVVVNVGIAGDHVTDHVLHWRLIRYVYSVVEFVGKNEYR